MRRARRARHRGRARSVRCVFRGRVMHTYTRAVQLACVMMVVLAGCYVGSTKQEPQGAVRLGDAGHPAGQRRAINVSPALKLSPPPGQWGGNYPAAAAAGNTVAVVWLQSRTTTDACVVGTWLGT